MKLDDFHYFVKGEAPHSPWLVFLHGLLGAAANWRRITPSFEKNYRILTYDQHDYSVNELSFLMGALNIERASLIGHSMGGRVALEFAGANPEKVEKLVIEDIGPEGTKEYGPDLVKLLNSIPVPFESNVKAKEFFLNELGDPRLGNFFYTSMKMNAEPTLVVRGKNSGALTYPVYKKMLKSNELIEGAEVDGAGHWVHFDKPKEFIGLLQTFLSK